MLSVTHRHALVERHFQLHHKKAHARLGRLSIVLKQLGQARRVCLVDGIVGALGRDCHLSVGAGDNESKASAILIALVAESSGKERTEEGNEKKRRRMHREQRPKRAGCGSHLSDKVNVDIVVFERSEGKTAEKVVADTACHAHGDT